MDVKVNHRQTSPCRERTGERALPGTHHPVDEDAVADCPRRTVHGTDYAKGAEQIAPSASVTPTAGDTQNVAEAAGTERIATSLSSRQKRDFGFHL